jgi:hypothetical protein
LFYAGLLTIAMIIDRGHGLDLDKLIVGLQNESELITRQADACCYPAWLLTEFDQQRCRVPKPRSCLTAFRLRADRRFVGYRNSPLSPPTRKHDASQQGSPASWTPHASSTKINGLSA